MNETWPRRACPDHGVVELAEDQRREWWGCPGPGCSYVIPYEAIVEAGAAARVDLVNADTFVRWRWRR